jgi:hypothetical protein
MNFPAFLHSVSTSDTTHKIKSRFFLYDCKRMISITGTLFSVRIEPNCYTQSVHLREKPMSTLSNFLLRTVTEEYIMDKFYLLSLNFQPIWLMNMGF